MWASPVAGDSALRRESLAILDDRAAAPDREAGFVLYGLGRFSS
jgi:hypothetical protein